eukprot:517805-Prymnesium_polylepis.1
MRCGARAPSHTVPAQPQHQREEATPSRNVSACTLAKSESSWPMASGAARNPEDRASRATARGKEARRARGKPSRPSD